jgi:hypothetical protein
MTDPYYKTVEERGEYAINAIRQNFYSTDERHIYYTHCRWDELYQEKAILWIGLMPGYYPERSPLMERIHWSTIKQGFTSFYAFNLFSFRVQHERLLPFAEENVTTVNLRVLEGFLKKPEVIQRVILHWGNSISLFHPVVMDTLTMIEAYGHTPMCISKNNSCNPQSALYASIASEPINFFDDSDDDSGHIQQIQ